MSIVRNKVENSFCPRQLLFDGTPPIKIKFKIILLLK